MVGESRNAKHCVFPLFCGSVGSKSKLAKAAGAEPAGQMRAETLHAVVARSTFPSQHVQKHLSFEPLLEAGMWKRCTPLWRQARFQVEVSESILRCRMLLDGQIAKTN